MEIPPNLKLTIPESEDLELIRHLARIRHHNYRLRHKIPRDKFPDSPYECSWAFEEEFRRKYRLCEHYNVTNERFSPRKCITSELPLTDAEITFLESRGFYNIIPKRTSLPNPSHSGGESPITYVLTASVYKNTLVLRSNMGTDIISWKILFSLRGVPLGEWVHGFEQARIIKQLDEALTVNIEDLCNCLGNMDE